jgi:hypothetical protein
MSTTIGYYFDCPRGLRELGEVVEAVLGCRLLPGPDAGTLQGRFCSIETSLARHSLEDDLGIAFSAHPYELQLRLAAPDLELLDTAIALASLVPSLLWQRAGIGGGLLVYDLQRRLVSYRVEGGVLRDARSGVPIRHPAHARQLFAQIEAG